MGEKKSTQYALEVLNLLCEWEECTNVASDIENLIAHIASEHLYGLSEDDLHCHWKDCEGFTENLTELRRHILLHAFHTKIKCHGKNLQKRKKMPDCMLSIYSRNIIPELPEPLVCCWDNCSEEFECPEHFYRHVDCHAESYFKKENLIYAVCLWHGCNRTFADHHKLKEHMRSHTQEKLVACPTCGGMFASRTKFFDHVQRQLPIDENDFEGTFICEYCSRKMNSERLLRDHMRHHVNHYKCPYCDMTCPTPSALQLHVTYRHSDNKPHACQYCEYRCKSENDLRKHLGTHSLIPTFKCPADGCSYATRSQTCYSVHYRKKHEGKQSLKYSCHLCDKICTRGNYLTKHLLNHHKFRWPSGHCRFRYRLHEDGIYRLQTVRYESLELSQTMMCETSESIDDPDSLMNQVHENNVDETNPFCTNQTVISTDEILSDNNSSVLPGSIVLCLEDGNKVQLPQNSSVACSSLSNSFVQEPEAPDSFLQEPETSGSFVQEPEPVLINIVDTEEKTSESGGSVLLIRTSRPFVNNQKRSVQLITKDSDGKVVLETAEIITQYDHA